MYYNISASYVVIYIYFIKLQQYTKYKRNKFVKVNTKSENIVEEGNTNAGL